MNFRNVDKSVITDFYYAEKVTPRHIEELGKVAEIVLLKNYSNYYMMHKEWKESAIYIALEKRGLFDKEGNKDAYNYTFTMFSNRFKNEIWKMSRTPNYTDLLAFRQSMNGFDKAEMEEVMLDKAFGETSESEEKFETFEEIKEFLPYLSGDIDFCKIKIPKDKVLNLLLFIKSHDKKIAKVKLPNYVDEDIALNVMYKIIVELIEDEDGE